MKLPSLTSAQTKHDNGMGANRTIVSTVNVNPTASTIIVIKLNISSRITNTPSVKSNMGSDRSIKTDFTNWMTSLESQSLAGVVGENLRITMIKVMKIARK